ncbi:MAG TPA: PH domain-containing protein [Pseudonocardia sp.]|nr:PH domain-containing protein [Pseudonocardia sp.]
MTNADLAAGPGVDAPTQWDRLDPRTLVALPIKHVGSLGPIVAVVFLGGGGQSHERAMWAVLPVLAVLVVGFVRWGTTRYRVGVERVELRSGLFNRETRSVRRDRIRTVDLRASLGHRMMGLTVVEVGTGTGSAKSGRLNLDAVTVAEGERLRRELLDRSGALPSSVVPEIGAIPQVAGHGSVEVARLNPLWLRYAPLTGSGLVAVGAVVGATFKVASDAGVNLVNSATVSAAGDRLTAQPLGLTLGVLVLVVLAVASVGSIALYAEGWWNYRLSREPDNTLRLRRGLVTTRSLSIEQSRIRGAEVIEPVLLRLAGGARCAAVTTGLDEKTSSKGTLLPPAPVALAHRVASAALLVEDPASATGSLLVRHPLAALRRRLTRAIGPSVAITVAAWWLHTSVTALAWLWPVSLLLVPAAVLLAADRYRNLGHALHAEHLVLSYGSLIKRRVALQRRGIIGWRLRQSPPQRWAGVLTLDAITAAGNGRYSVVDIAPERAVELIEHINPELVT